MQKENPIPTPFRLWIYDPETLGDNPDFTLLDQFLKEDLPFDSVSFRFHRIIPPPWYLQKWIQRIRDTGRTVWIHRFSGISLLYPKTGVILPEGNPPPPFPFAVSIHSPLSITKYLPYHPIFFLFGHIYETPSKKGIPPRGTETLKTIVSLSSIPVLALGGITPEKEEEVLSCGAYGIATIRNVWLWKKKNKKV